MKKLGNMVVSEKKRHNRTMNISGKNDNILKEMYKLTNHCTKIDNGRLSRKIKRRINNRFNSMVSIGRG